METKKIIIYGSILLLALIVVLGIFFGLKERPAAKVKIVFWGFEEKEVYNDLIEEFNKQYSYIEIEYIKKSPTNYEKDLLNAMAAGSGPDIFPIGHNWLPRYQDKISPVPSQLFTLKEYYDTFVDVTSYDFISEGNIWAVPFYVDSLALYWNKDIFNTAGIPEPPKTWDDFLEAVKKLTLRDERGNITRAAAAIGASGNIGQATDILSVLMLQAGAQMTNEEKSEVIFDQSVSLNGEEYKAGEAALKFYTDFANPQKPIYTWHQRMDEAVAAFSQGKVAMMIDYSSALETIRKKSPYLNFAVSALPQIKDARIAINYADYFAQAVWSKSKNPKYAWQFILWLAEKENLKKYLELAKKPASRRDLVAWQKYDPDLGVFVNSVLSARSWYQIDDLAIKKIFAEMIDSVVFGQTRPEEAIVIAANRITLLMRK